MTAGPFWEGKNAAEEVLGRVCKLSAALTRAFYTQELEFRVLGGLQALVQGSQYSSFGDFQSVFIKRKALRSEYFDEKHMCGSFPFAVSDNWGSGLGAQSFGI